MRPVLSIMAMYIDACRGHTERYVMVYVPLMDTDADCEAGSYQNRFADAKASDIIHGGGLLEIL